MPYRNPYSRGAAFPDMSPTINNFVDNLVRLKTHQEDIDMRGRQLQQQKEQFDVTSAESKFQLEAAKKKQAELQKPMDLTVHPMFLSLPDESKQAALKFFTENQFTDERGIGTVESVMRGTEILEKSKPLFQTVMGPVVKAKQVAVTTAWEEFQQAQATQDPKKIQIAKGKYDQAYLAYGDSLGKFDEHMKLLDTQEQAKELKQMEIDAATARIRPERPSSVAPGGTLVNPQTGQTIYTNPNRPESNRPVSVAPGGTLVNPQTGAPIYTAPNKPDKGTTETELRAQRKELADNESKLLLNKTSEGAGPLADLHNERSEKPYAYQWKPGKLYGGEYVQIKLPKIKGKQVTAKDVYDTASQRGMTYDEVLKAIGALGPPPPVAAPPTPGELRGIGMPKTSIRQNYKVNY